ncbi:MAG: hypothetical protein ACFFB8_17690 [Promethearchaeota archaeon]
MKIEEARRLMVETQCTYFGLGSIFRSFVFSSVLRDTRFEPF